MTRKRPMPAPGEVDVWYGDTEILIDSELAQKCRAFLSNEERSREKRFRFDADRRQFLLAHALLRMVLSQYLACTPASISFGRNYYGKPSLVSPATSGLAFNISHTAGLAVCAIGVDCSVGVDVERSDRTVDELTLAKRYFSPSEYELLASTPAKDRRQVFYQLWTLKEAYIKARGMGLTIPLADFAFELPKGQTPTVSFANSFTEEPHDWRFSSVTIADRHRAALAVRIQEGAWLGCCWREMPPLCDSPSDSHYASA